jgi:hypothetical protein
VAGRAEKTAQARLSHPRINHGLAGECPKGLLLLNQELVARSIKMFSIGFD